MPTSPAVAYIATTGYLFQTVLSAIQTRRNVDDETEIHIVALAKPGDAAPDLGVMAAVAASHGIAFHQVTPDVLDGLHPMFGRLFLDRILPERIGKILYLDGDTQVRGSLRSLLNRPLERGRLAAVMDPMTAVRRSHLGLRRQIDRAWDAAAMPARARLGYVNSGVLMFHRADLPSFRERVLAAHSEKGSAFTHPDQDAINFALWNDIEHLELEWNYPGFLLGVRCPARDDARIVHFMSSPRPWHGGYLPWGRASYRPYADLVRQHPELSPHWKKPGLRRTVRNHAQQFYKSCSEGKVWRSPQFRDSLELVYPQRLTSDASSEWSVLTGQSSRR